MSLRNSSTRNIGFYPRHPRGWRRGKVFRVCIGSKFLSTPPSRVATADRGNQLGEARFLSTPPSRVATRSLQFPARSCWFLSTPPSRVATLSASSTAPATSVSIHATIAGGDRRPCRVYNPVDVSIHATLAGGDVAAARLLGRDREFLSTPPSRVATALRPGRSLLALVSIHATLAGGDVFHFVRADNVIGFLSTPPSRVATRRVIDDGSYLSFLSTPPSRVATILSVMLPQVAAVSIHATLAGGDASTASNMSAWHRFYPRHPRGWRRGNTCGPGAKLTVSIHATLAGGDGKPLWPCGMNTLFLSTPPSRVATVRHIAGLIWIASFYPRHPRGWRPALCCISGNSSACFYPRHPRGWRRLIQP